MVLRTKHAADKLVAAIIAYQPEDDALFFLEPGRPKMSNGISNDCLGNYQWLRHPLPLSQARHNL